MDGLALIGAARSEARGGTAAGAERWATKASGNGLRGVTLDAQGARIARGGVAWEVLALFILLLITLGSFATVPAVVAAAAA